MARYDFDAEPLKKFSVGAGAWYAKGRTTTAGTFINPNGTNIEPGLPAADGIKAIADGGQARAFVEYRPRRAWKVRLDVDNLLDELTVMGAQRAGNIDVSVPRTFTGTVVYRF